MNLFQLFYQLLRSENLSRFRSFLIWSIISYTPALLIYKGVLQWTIYVPGSNISQDNSYSFLALILGSSLVPVLFFITNGLGGFHLWLGSLLDAVFGLKRLRENEILPPERLRKLKWFSPF